MFGKVAGVVGFVVAVIGIKLATREAVSQVVAEATTQPAPLPIVTTPVKPIHFTAAPLLNPVKAAPAPVLNGPKAPASLTRQWTAPSEGSNKPGDLLNPGRITNLAFHRDGDKLVTASRAGIDVWDVATGKKLHSFPAAKYAPIVSRDGRYAAIPTESDVKIFDTATGKPTARYTLVVEKIHRERWGSAGGAFSPSGETLFLALGRFGNDRLLALDSQTGTAKTLTQGPPGRGELLNQFEQLEPVPGGIKFLVTGSVVRGKGKGVSVTEYDPATRKQRDVTALTFKPWTLSPNRGMRTSTDGLYVAAHDHESVAVIDRIFDKPLWKLKESMTNYGEPTFTPDASRLAFLRHPNYYLFSLNGPKTYPSDTIELHDVKTGKKLAAWDSEAAGFVRSNLTSFEFSPDGKTVAVAAGTRIAVFDFEAAFGLAPLPPKPLPTKAEAYPVE